MIHKINCSGKLNGATFRWSVKLFYFILFDHIIESVDVFSYY